MCIIPYTNKRVASSLLDRFNDDYIWCLHTEPVYRQKIRSFSDNQSFHVSRLSPRNSMNNFLHPQPQVLLRLPFRPIPTNSSSVALSIQPQQQQQLQASLRYTDWPCRVFCLLFTASPRGK